MPDGDITAIVLIGCRDAGISVVLISKRARSPEQSVCGDVNGTAFTIAAALGVDAVDSTVPN